MGNLGNGWINAYNPTTGAFIGTLDNIHGHHIAVGGLWGLAQGGSGFGGTGSLVFSSGPDGQSKGLLGTFAPAAPVPALASRE